MSDWTLPPNVSRVNLGRWKIVATRGGVACHVYGPYWTRWGAERQTRLPQFRGDDIEIVRVDIAEERRSRAEVFRRATQKR